MSSIPLAELPEDVAERVAALGAHQVNLYRALAHAPGLLRAWMDFAWLLRGHTATSRRLRELMILRTALLHHSPYEWHQHRRMAREEGVSETQVAELEMWRTSDAFDAEEKAALALTDAIVATEVTPEIIEELDKHFDHTQRVELTVTAAFYAMVPRVLDALGVPIEGTEHEAAVPRVPAHTVANITETGKRLVPDPKRHRPTV
jgi:alkylhydroperoxidase family enzyme